MAPNKKYLSLEEAAAQLGVKPDELIRLREKGDVRGFADRGTWKFKADDVEECRRRRQPDSDPDMKILDDLGSSDIDELGSQATMIRKSGASDSDSDVRMIGDNRKKNSLSGSSDELPTLGMDSDSDVRLVEPTKGLGNLSSSDVTVIIPNAPKKPDSDSDVRLIDKPSDSDSDVKIVTPARSLADSDSDIRLAPFSDSDSDVKLIGPKSSLKKSDSDVTLITKGKTSSQSVDPGSKTHAMLPLDSGSGIDLDMDGTDSQGTSLLGSDDSSISLAGDSGIRLSEDSGIRLSEDSGIRLGADSGIRLGGDSGIRLSDDSGVQLKQPADSGISLEGKDSGIRLAESGIVIGDDSGLDLEGSGKTFDLLAESSVSKRKGGSSKKLSKLAPQTEQDLKTTDSMSFDDDFGATAPMLHVSDDDDASASDLDMFDASATSELDSFDDNDQNVVMFEDDEEDAVPATKKRSPKTVEESIFEIDEVAEETGEEFEVSDDDLSGETDLDDLAFDDAEEDSGDFSTGSSKLGFGGSKKVSVAKEVEWSAGFCSLLLASLCMLIAGTWVSADLLRTVWAGGEDASAVYPGIAGLLAAFWK